MKRILVTGLVVTALFGLSPPRAVAGGNWLEFRQPQPAVAGGAAPDGVSDRARWDVFASGETVVAHVGYLSATLGPEDGPFHLWIERGEEVRAGRPIPSSALRVGTFRMAASGRGGTATFTVPSLPRGQYTLSVCDNPCRTWGFDEFVQGWITVAPTIGEAKLVARIRELRSDAWEARYALREELREALRGERSLEAQVASLTDELDQARANLAGLGAGASGPPAVAPRPMVDGAATAWLAAAIVVAAVLQLWVRRRRTVAVPDTPAELLRAAGPVPSERVLEDLDV
jgi:hypothetical protein